MSTAPKNEKVVFVRQAAERISKVVRTVEQGDRDGSPLTFRSVGGGGGDKVFRVCTFTGAWSINAQKTVMFLNQTNTVVATNLFANIAQSGISRNCAIAKDGGTWYLVAAQC